MYRRNIHTESLKESLQQMKAIREGTLPKKTWQDYLKGKKETKKVKTKLEELSTDFEFAKKIGSKFVAVKIRMDGYPDDEIIINPFQNIEDKLEYYQKTYDEDLNHRFASGISIVDWTFGDSFDDIQDELVD